MSDKTHRIIAAIGGIAFVAIGAALHAHVGGGKYDQALQGGLEILGALGFTAIKPLFGSTVQK